jgi:phospholipid transport system substrate-binding protein
MTIAGSQGGLGGTGRIGRRQALRVVLAATAIAAAAARAAPGWAAASDPKSFIDELGADVLGILKDSSLSLSQRRAKFRELFAQNFDVPTIGKFVAGRSWSRASSEEQTKYLDTFRNYVAGIYAEQFAGYKGVAFKTLATRSLGEGESSVKSQIEQPGQAPINVDFRVKGAPGAFKITDVTVENVSLIVTKRDEFASILDQGGVKAATDKMQAILSAQGT